ncbi:hypothetical protein H4582DRAFT_1065252 [Lactarius indigo]|nr:hypothetical protein H4582DRAFT_1065252 [Lactarius indigo]
MAYSPCLDVAATCAYHRMITSSLTRLCGNIFWDPYGSKSSLHHILCETHHIHNVSVGGDTPLARNHYIYRVVSTLSMQAQPGVGLHLECPSLRTTPGRISSEMDLTPGSPQKSEGSSIAWIRPIGQGATLPKASVNLYLGPPTPETHHLPPVSAATSRVPPQRVLEGPYLTPGGSIGDAAGASIEWEEGTEAGVSERGSLYGQRSKSGAARSIWPEQQIARWEEDARLKEDARGLETAARMAFTWAQSLEKRAGKTHDAAMQAEARAKRMDTMIWEEAEMLFRQAETAKRKREVRVVRRGIAVQRAKEVGREERQSRRNDAEPSMKGDAVRNKGQEAIRVGEEVKRRKTEVKQSKEKPSKGRTAKDQVATKGVVASAWEKLKGRISRHPNIHKQNKSRIRQYKNNVFDDNGTSVVPGSSSEADIDPETSTPAFVPVPSSRRVEHQRSTIKVTRGKRRQELRSKSRVVASVRTTSSGISLQYTVKSVHSYKERMNRTPGGYYRHKR